MRLRCRNRVQGLYAVYVTILTFILNGCAQPAPNPQYGRAEVSETLTTGLSPHAIAGFIAAVEGDSTFGDRQISLDVMPTFPIRRVSVVEAQTYGAALEDARAKAEALATKMGITLGSVQAISEAARSGGDLLTSAAQPPLKSAQMARVNADPTGMVMLAVTFSSTRGPIAVFGSRAGAMPGPTLSDATGISVNLNAHGDTIGDAAKRLRSADDAVRRIAREHGASGGAVIVQQSGIRSF